MKLPDFLTATPEGEIRLTGHRIDLFHVVYRYNEGDSAEMLAIRYPTLSLALVHKVIAFYLENRAEVDAYVSNYSEALAMQERDAVKFDVNILRQRLAAKALDSIGHEAQV